MKDKKLVSWTAVEKEKQLYFQRNSKKRFLTGVGRFLLAFVLLAGFIFLFGLMWVQKYFSDVTLDIMIMQIRMPLQGTGGGMILKFILQVLLPSVGCIFVLILAGFFIRRRKKALFIGKKAVFPNRILSLILAFVFTGITFWQAATELELSKYLANRNTTSDFIEKNYIYPKSENLTFPKQKRNLIYIYLESMESTFLTADQGGQMSQDLMPDLFEIARNNITFSDKDKIGGAVPLSGMGVTSAGMVAQTAGLPLFLQDGWDGGQAREVFIPNAITLGDILAENGYAQYLMVGSNSKFGARDQYYKTHGDAVILDLFTARESGVIAKDYDNKFWGMEDEYLYEYAKQELNEIAKDNKPFCFSMLTVDTHFPDGYICNLCKNEYEDQYSNVLACASRQVGNFLEWLEQQDFYKNTTVIISGDHLSMNADYYKRNNIDVMQRRVYNVFINTAGVTPVQTKNRMFASIDMFPSTLAALGVEIKGNRLGLGTNLFSDKPTLLEMYEYNFMNDELLKKSDFYNKTFN